MPRFRAREQFTLREVYYILLALYSTAEEVKELLSATPTIKAALKEPRMMTIRALRLCGGVATADEISGITKRARATESGILSGLVEAGVIYRLPRKGRKILFSLKGEEK